MFAGTVHHNRGRMAAEREAAVFSSGVHTQETDREECVVWGGQVKSRVCIVGVSMSRTLVSQSSNSFPWCKSVTLTVCGKYQTQFSPSR